MIETVERKKTAKLQGNKEKTLYYIAEKVFRYFAVYALSGLSVAGEINPLGIAYLLNFDLKDITVGAVISCLGYWNLTGSYLLMKYIASVLIGSIIRFLFFSKKENLKFIPFITMFSVLLPWIIMAFLTETDVYFFINATVETLLAGMSSFFFSYAKKSFEKTPVCSGKKDNISAMIFISVLITAFFRINIFNINIGMLLSAFLICSFAIAKGENYSCIAGVSIATAWVILKGKKSILPVLFPIAGLLSGVFGRFGRCAVSAGYVLVSTALLFSERSLNISYLIGTLVGVAVFMFLPSDLIFDCIGGYNLSEEKNQVKYICLLIKDKLSLLSDALMEIRKTTNTVSAVRYKHYSDSYETVYQNVCEKLCRYCPNNIVCWQKNYNITICVIDKLIARLKLGKELFPSDYPEYFKETCNSYMDISEAVEDGYKIYLTAKKNRRQMEALRSVVTEQLDGISGMIKALSENMDNIYSSDLNLQNRIYDYFSHKKIQIKSCFCFYDKNNILTLQIEIPSYKTAFAASEERICDLSDICERNLCSPKILKNENFSKLTYEEVAKLKVEFGFVQKNGDREEFCGDSLKQIENCEKKAYVLLSDGMGTGKEAAVESTMTIDMLRDLILRGGDPENSIKVINSSLMCKTAGECMATVDITSFDLYTGLTKLYKSASAPTYILKDGKAQMVSSWTLPLGILKNIKPQEFSFNLNAGDMVINLTDGATESGDQWILSEIESLKDKNPKEIAEGIYNTVLKRKCGKYLDDITISVMKIEKA